MLEPQKVGKTTHWSKTHLLHPGAIFVHAPPTPSKIILFSLPDNNSPREVEHPPGKRGPTARNNLKIIIPKTCFKHVVVLKV